MRFNVFVRWKSETQNEFCHWPVMRSRDGEHHFGGLLESYPTEYTEADVGAALAFALRNLQVADLQVKEAPDYDNQDAEEAGGCLSGCPGDVGARDSF